MPPGGPGELAATAAAEAESDADEAGLAIAEG